MIIIAIFAFLFGCGFGMAILIVPLVLYDDMWHKRYKELERQIREEKELGERKG